MSYSNNVLYIKYNVADESFNSKKVFTICKMSKIWLICKLRNGSTMFTSVWYAESPNLRCLAETISRRRAAEV